MGWDGYTSFGIEDQIKNKARWKYTCCLQDVKIFGRSVVGGVGQVRRCHRCLRQEQKAASSRNSGQSLFPSSACWHNRWRSLFGGARSLGASTSVAAGEHRNILEALENAPSCCYIEVDLQETARQIPGWN